MEGWVFCCVVFVAAANSCYGFCQFPPSLWCSSPEIIEECHVSSHCQGWKCLAQLDAKPVDLAIYYESKCESCADLFLDQLEHAYKDVGEIMNLQFVPYGNTKETPNGDSWNFECEDGTEQCIGNIIQACAIHMTTNISLQLKFIQCMMTTDAEQGEAAKVCANNIGESVLWVQSIKCSKESQGKELEHQMGLRTKAVRAPDHLDLPWVSINGVRLTGDIYEKNATELISLICREYRGPLPYGCRIVKTDTSHSCHNA